MRQKNIGQIVSKAEELATKVENLLSSLAKFEDSSGKPFDIQQIIRGTDSSISQIAARFQSAIGMIVEFRKATQADLVPLQVLSNLQQSIADAISAIDTFNTNIDNLMNAHGGLQTFNYSKFIAQTKNGQGHNLEGQFQNLLNTSEIFLQRFFEAFFILKPRGAYSFQAAASTLSSVINTANDSFTALKSSLKQVSVSEENLKSKDEEATTHLDEIKRLKVDGDADRKSIADYLGQATQQKSAIQAVYDEAIKLGNSVKAYDATFDRFQKQLDDRDESFVTGKSNLDALIEKFEEQKSGIEQLINRSEQMLSSATVSGLASNFYELRNKLTRELWWARFTFYIGIILLMISAIPLLGFITMPLVIPFLRFFYPDMLISGVDIISNEAQNGWQYLGQVLARIAILLPAAWFVSFTAIRHSSLFRLREHYAYKYSMAVSVEGFKQQAPIYEQEIAALVLEQLAFNPADKLVPSRDIKEGKAPGISGFLFEKIRARTESLTPGSKTK